MRLYVFFLNQLQHPNPHFFYSIQLNLFLQQIYIDNGLGNMNKNKFNITKVRYRRSKFMRKSYVAQKSESRRVQTVKMIGSVGCLGHPQAYGFHYPWIALGASPLILVKKNTKFSPISFLWGDISRHKR
jgi:hypothetical protein